MDLRRSFQLGTELAGPGVEAASLGNGDSPVQNVAQELMPEVVQAVTARWFEHDVVDKLLERHLEGSGRQVHDPGEDIED